MNFADFDVLARGPVVPAMVEAFDQYWNCAAAVPITQINEMTLSPAEIEQGLRKLKANRELMAETPYAQAMRSNRLVTTPWRDIPLFNGRTEVATDDPAKISARPEDVSTHLTPQLADIVKATQKEVLLVSPYFVPGDAGVDWLAGLTRRGVAVKVITNSLATTDVAAVHAGYSRYRAPMLQAGVELYEMKSGPGGAGATGTVPHPPAGSSKAGLHAKTFIFDRRWVFVGSMNLDPRSIKLNTELGLLIDCPELARQLIEGLENHLPERAYQLKLTPAGLTWTTTERGRSVVLDAEPAAGFRKKLMWRASSLLPIEGQL
jgi:putative cardiolipin synthase